MFQDGLHAANSHAKSVWVYGKSNTTDGDVILGDEEIPVKQHVVLHWSGKMYPAGARYMGDFRTTGMPAALMMDTLIQLFLVTVMRMLDQHAKLFSKRPAKRRRVGKQTEDAPDPADEERTLAKRAYQPGSVRMYVEEVMSTSGEHVATRLHIVVLGDEDSSDNFCKSLYEVIMENEELYKKRLAMSAKKRRPYGEHEKWRTVTGLEKFGELSDVYTNTQRCGDNYDALMNRRVTITDRDNPGCPLNSFSMENAIKKVKDNVNVPAELRNIEEYHPNGGIEDEGTIVRIGMFGEGALRVLGSEMHPEIFAQKYRLSYQRAQSTALALEDVAKILGHTLRDAHDNSCTELGVNPMILTKNNIANLCEMSDTLSMRFTGSLAMLRGHIQSMRTRPDYRRSEEQVRKEIREFVCRAWNPDVDSNISAVGRRIFTYSQLRTYQPIIYDLDDDYLPGRSGFGRMVQSWISRATYHFMIADAQMPIFTLINGRFNAYDCNLGLHWNALLMGESSTGKSYAFDLVQKCSIDGTVTKFTRRTANADQVQQRTQGENNDIIEIYEEMPKSLLQEDKFNGDEADQFKEQLTNGRMVIKSCWIDEDGVRQQKVSTNECIGVRMGATNNPITAVGEALRSRFQLIYFPKTSSKKKSISHMQYAQMKKDANDRIVTDRFMYENHEEQLRVYLYYKLAHCGILEMPSLSTVREIHLRLVEGVKHKLMRSTVHARDEQRMLMHAKTLTIRYACHRVFNCPGGPCYGKPDFEIEDMMHVERHALDGECATEIAVMSFVMVSDNFLNNKLSIVLKGVANVHRQEKSPYKEQNENSAPSRSMVQLDGSDINYNYIKIPMSLPALCHQVSVLMDTEKGKLSKEIVRSILEDVQNTKVRCRNYVGPDGAIDDASPITQSVAARFLSRVCYIHQHVFEENREGVINDIIEYAMHDYSDTKTLTIGAVDESNTEMFKTIEWHRVPGRIIKHQNYLHVPTSTAKVLGFTEEDLERATNATSGPTIVVDRTFDELAARDPRIVVNIEE